jgi:hypothetical protein
MFNTLLNGTTCMIELNISCHEFSPSLSETRVSHLLQGMVVHGRHDVSFMLSEKILASWQHVEDGH